MSTLEERQRAMANASRTVDTGRAECHSPNGIHLSQEEAMIVADWSRCNKLDDKEEKLLERLLGTKHGIRPD